jgi:hypothetical protein
MEILKERRERQREKEKEWDQKERRKQWVQGNKQEMPGAAGEEEIQPYLSFHSFLWDGREVEGGDSKLIYENFL